jgi:gamma-glutamylcyclotransferase (GGCT)/AIG2-like uncharacterized protein YtfP
MKLYLAYGANTNHGNMANRCPDAKYVCNVTLHHHRLAFRVVADVVPQRGGKVVCAMWIISAKDEAALDRFEGFPNLYVKRYVSMRLQGRKHRVMFYVMRTRRYEDLPSEGYEACLREGYAECGMPLGQIDWAIRRAKAWQEKNSKGVYETSWSRTAMPASAVDIPLAASDVEDRDKLDAADEFMMNWYNNRKD